MDSAIEKVAKSCEACHEAKQGPAKAPLNPWVWPSRPWQQVHVDYAGPFMGKNFLLVIDAHLKWGEVVEMNSTTSSKTIAALLRLMDFHSSLSVTMGHSLHRTNLQLFFRREMVYGTHIELHTIQRLMERLTYRSTPHSTNQAPCELFLDRKVRTRLDLFQSIVEDHVFHRQGQQSA